MGPILNTILGAGIKILCNLVNAWLEQKRQDQMMLAVRDQATMEALFKKPERASKRSFC